MPQQFQAVKCYKCNTFQVQQVKKVQKFSCAVCGEPQTIQRIYAISHAAKDIRLHIQRLNMGAAAAMEAAEDAAFQRLEDMQAEGTDGYGTVGPEPTANRPRPNHTDWSVFKYEEDIPDTDADELAGEGLVTALPDRNDRKRGRAAGGPSSRKQKQQRSDQDGDDDFPHQNRPSFPATQSFQRGARPPPHASTSVQRQAALVYPRPGSASGVVPQQPHGPPPGSVQQTQQQSGSWAPLQGGQNHNPAYQPRSQGPWPPRQLHGGPTQAAAGGPMGSRGTVAWGGAGAGAGAGMPSSTAVTGARMAPAGAAAGAGWRQPPGGEPANCCNAPAALHGGQGSGGTMTGSAGRQWVGSGQQLAPQQQSQQEQQPSSHDAGWPRQSSSAAGASAGGRWVQPRPPPSMSGGGVGELRGPRQQPAGGGGGRATGSAKWGVFAGADDGGDWGAADEDGGGPDEAGFVTCL